MKYVAQLILAIAFLFITACTSSEWLLSAIYDRFDDKLATELKEYADFTPEQSDAIDLFALEYQRWHRTQHLPKYAQIMRDIHLMLQENQLIDRSQVAIWSADIEGYFREMAVCHPLNRASDFLRTLSDGQIDQLLEHGIKEHEDFVEDHIDMTEEERIDKRHRNTLKWFRRFELNLNDEQRDVLRQTIASERLMNEEGTSLWVNWLEGFVDVLRNRDTPDFPILARQHVDKLWTLQDDEFPEIVEFNQNHWIDYFASLAASQTEQQQQEFSDWLIKMAQNLEAMSASVSKNEEAIEIDERVLSCQISDYSIDK